MIEAAWNIAPRRSEMLLASVVGKRKPSALSSLSPRSMSCGNDGASGVALLMEIAHHLSDFTRVVIQRRGRTGWIVDKILAPAIGGCGRIGDRLHPTADIAGRVTREFDGLFDSSNR